MTRQNYIARIGELGHKPIIVVSKIDICDPTMRTTCTPTAETQKLLDNVAQWLDVPPNMVLFLVNYIKEDERVFAIDRQNYKVLLKILQYSSQYAERLGLLDRD